MGKPKDSSKNRKWEQIRRERLNQTFSDLCKELPSKTNGGLLSKKAILVESLAFIQQLQKEKKELQDTIVQQQTRSRNGDIPGPAEVRAHIGSLLQRQSQLLELLQNAGIAVPPDANAEQVSAEWSPRIFENGAMPTEEKGTSTQDKKKKMPVSVLTPANGVVHRVVLAEKTKPMNPLSRKNKDLKLRRKVTKKHVGPGPLVVQSLPQLVLAPGATPAVPVIVSVAGVKTLNPVIVVQSKSLVTCNTTASFSARPIRPCPAVRPTGTKAKVPIPALKRKTNDFPPKKVPKGKTKKKVEPVKEVPQVPAKSSSSACSSEPTVPEAPSLDKNGSRNNDRAEPAVENNVQKDPSSVPNGVLAFPEIEAKENDWVDKNGKRVSGDGMSVANKRMKSIEIVQENMKDLAGYLNSSSGQNNSFTSSPSKSAPKSGSYSISALCSLEQQQNQQQQEQQNLQQQQNQQPQEQQNQLQQGQHNLQQQNQQQQGQHNLQQQQEQHSLQQQQNQQQEQHNLQQQQNEQEQRNLQKHHEQQNHQGNLQEQKYQLQNQQQHRHQTSQNQLQQDKRQQKKQRQQQNQHLQQVNQQQQIDIHHSEQQVCVDSNITSQGGAKHAYVVSKTKEVYLPSNEQYLEWVEKSGSKSRFDTRTYHSYNSYSSPVVHNSRNTFMPITEAEVFDGSENAFGLSLNAPDISGDLFTSLQVPNGGQHSESISPTAAFLLTFPLVSTSKASELLPDESGCENTDSQSGIKTILQIGNIDSSLNKCSNNIFSVTDEGLNNFGLTSHFATNSQKDGQVIRSGEDKSAQGNKDCTTLVYKETAVLVHKDAGNSSLDQSALYLNKSNQVQQNNAVSKPDQQTSHIVSTVDLPVVNQSSVTSVLAAKPHTKCSNSETSESQKQSTRDRKDDRNSSWAASNTPLNPFGDFGVTNSLRQDCTLNFPTLPSTVVPLSSTSTSQPYPTSDSNYKAPYCQPSVTSSFSIAQTSSNIGILSWSTLPAADTYSTSRNNPKLSRFHDIFSYRSTGSTEGNPSVSSSYVMPSDPKVQTNYATPSEHSFFQEPSTGTDVRSKTNVESYSSRSRSDISQKQFPSNSVSKQTYNQGMSQHTAMVEGKQACSQGVYDKHNSIIGQYPMINVQSKQGMNGNLNKVSSGKQIFSDAFSRSSSGKHANCAHWNDPKEPHQRQQVQSFSLNVSSVMDPKSDGHLNSVNDGKKHSSNNIGSSSKERTTLGTCIASNGTVLASRETRVSQCDQTDTNNVAVQKEAFKPSDQMHVHKQSHQMNSKNVQRHYQQPELHHNQETNQMHQQQSNSTAATLPCARSAKTTMSIHRPPVNWMTAPDIRSSLQNTPAFGNNQTAFYITDHQKEADGGVSGAMFDTTFHCIELPHASGQGIFKNSDLQMLGSDQLEGIHEPTAWSPSKSGNNNVLGSMLIPSTLPTLVGDLALGDSNANISRPFLPNFTSESSPCSKKTSKRSHLKNSDKTIDDGQSAEFSTNFLSVSQLVDSGANRNKGRPTSLHGNRISNVPEGPVYPVYLEQDISQCSQSKQSSSKSSYSAEALLSNSVINSYQMNRKKRSSHSAQYSSNYAPPDVTSGTFAVTPQSQCNFLPDLSASRSNEFQGGLSHPESLPNPFMIPSTSCNTNASHRNGVNPEDESQIRRVVPQAPAENLHLTGSMTANKQVPSNDVGMSYESNFPAFLPPVSVAMTHYPYAQDTLYSTPRFQMHPNANNPNNNIQSPSANTLTNFHLSTIFPEINGKVLC